MNRKEIKESLEQYYNFVQSNLYGGSLKEALKFGLIAEIGEFAELYQKHLRDGVPLNREEVLLELGDIYFYAFANLAEGFMRFGFDTTAIFFLQKVKEHTFKDFEADILAGLVKIFLADLLDEPVNISPGLRAHSIINLLLFTVCLNFKPEEVMEANMQKLIERKSKNNKKEKIEKVISKEWPVDVLLYEDKD